MKKLTFTIIALLACSVLSAQDDDWTNKVRESEENARNAFEEYRRNAIKEFEDNKAQILKEFEEFRRKANEEYAMFMKNPWTEFKPKPVEVAPIKPKPVKPIVYEPSPIEPRPNEPVKPHDTPIIFNMKPTAPKPVSVPIPVEPDEIKPRPNEDVMTYHFYGTPMKIHFDSSQSIHLADATEKSVAATWTQLSQPYYDNLLMECLNEKQQKHLCDWAYITLTKRISETCCGMDSNEAAVMHTYLLTQSGYQVRIGRADDRLHLLVGSNEKIYGYSYFVIDNMSFYCFDKLSGSKSMYIFDHAFPKETTMSLAISQPAFFVAPTDSRTVTSKRYPNVKATVSMNQNLIDFYNDYPLSSQWTCYSSASLSDVVKSTLYPSLKKAIKGKSETEAVEMLLNFVQTGFEYQTDDEQFGYERPLFPDESFYYPYCDCEDRSILFACMVRELLGLDVVLLHYPGHLATAVKFNGNVNGDFLNLIDGRYTVCDPTYIGASIGMSMSQFKDVKIEVERF